MSRHGGQGIEVTMPYIIVRESYINNSCVVDGLPSNEVRLITEKVSPVMSINDPAPDTLWARPRQPGGRETLGIRDSELWVFFQFQSCSPSHFRDERHWRVEFSTEAYNLLNALEQIGYKVITSSSFVTGHKKFDTKV